MTLVVKSNDDIERVMNKGLAVLGEALGEEGKKLFIRQVMLGGVDIYQNNEPEKDNYATKAIATATSPKPTKEEHKIVGSDGVEYGSIDEFLREYR